MNLKAYFTEISNSTILNKIFYKNQRTWHDKCLSYAAPNPFKIIYIEYW